MTENEFHGVLSEWQTRLGLDRWDIELKLDHPDLAPSEVHAHCYPHDHYDEAIIHIASDWRKWDRDKVNRVVVHELVHVLFREVEGVAMRGRSDSFEYETCSHAIEQTTEHLTRCLVGLVQAEKFAERRPLEDG